MNVMISGTGKSLSIICSSLQWLLDRKEKGQSGFTESDKFDGNDDEPDWMRNFTVDDKAHDDDKTFKHGRSPFRLRKHFKEKVAQVFSDSASKQEAELNDGEFLLEDYESEEESSSKRKHAAGFNSSSEDDKECSDDEQGRLQVFFCSRTHSQLSQFVKELRKTVLASKIKVVCLGSRNNMCINEGVSFFVFHCLSALPDT